MSYLPLILLFVFLIPSHSLTSAPTISANPIYSDAGIFTFDTTPYYGTANSTLNPALFSLTFANRTQLSINYHFGYAIQQINYQFSNTNLNYSVWVSGPKAATSIQAELYTNNANKINILSIRYVTIEPVTGIYGFVYTRVFPMTTFSNGNYFDCAVTGLGPFNLAQVNVWNVYVGIDATLAANLQIDVYLIASAPNSTSINFRVSTITPTPYYFTSAIVGAFLFNPNDLLALPHTLKFTVGSLQSTVSLTYSDGLNIVRNYNSIVGMVSHHIKSQTFFNELTTIIASTSISASSNYPYFYYEFSYLILQFVVCTNPTAYLMLANNICYDACPPRYYSNSYSECNSCLYYDCYYCTVNGSCSQCSAALDFRVINNATLRCQPMASYYDDGVNSQALPCNLSNCLTCTSATSCLSCSAGQYLATNNSCVDCMSSCLNCSSASNCLNCVIDFIFINGTCVVDCSIINFCHVCSKVLSSVICSSCKNRYSLVNNSCIYQCANGSLASNEQCNPNFTCTANSSGGTVCSLNSLVINLVAINKQTDGNAMSMIYSISPSNLDAFNSINWSSVVQQSSSLKLNFTSFSYDVSKGELHIGVSYAQNLNLQNLNLRFSFPNLVPFNLLPIITSSNLLIQSNNLSLQYYPQYVYSMANLLDLISKVMSILVFAFFIIGFYSSKLIMLEWITVFQLAFLSLLTMENLSPTFASLRFLSYSCGYSLSILPFQSKLNPRFISLKFSLPFLNNYNFNIVFMIIPLILSFILYIINCLKYQSSNQFLTKHSQLLRGEAVFYALMFSAYYLFIATGIEMYNFAQINGTMIIGGMALHYILIASLFIYAVFLVKMPHLFGQFQTKFSKNVFLISYYCWVICERILTSIALLLIQFKYQSSTILAIIGIQLLFIGFMRPYIGNSENPNLRPIVNLIISALIQLIFIVNDFFASSLGLYVLYLPVVILGLLSITFLYNIYYLIKEIRSSQKQNQQNVNQQIEDQSKFMSTQRAKLNSHFLHDQSLLSVSNKPELTEQKPNLTKDSLIKIKEQCLLVKTLEERNNDESREVELNWSISEQI